MADQRHDISREDWGDFEGGSGQSERVWVAEGYHQSDGPEEVDSIVSLLSDIKIDGRPGEAQVNGKSGVKNINKSWVGSNINTGPINGRPPKMVQQNSISSALNPNLITNKRRNGRVGKEGMEIDQLHAGTDSTRGEFSSHCLQGRRLYLSYLCLCAQKDGQYCDGIADVQL